MEYHIRVNRWGNVAVFRVHTDHEHGNVIRFFTYADDVETALAYCGNHPTTIISTSEGL